MWLTLNLLWSSSTGLGPTGVLRSVGPIKILSPGVESLPDFFYLAKPELLPVVVTVVPTPWIGPALWFYYVCLVGESNCPRCGFVDSDLTLEEFSAEPVAVVVDIPVDPRDENH